jgi:hypothetical protein
MTPSARGTVNTLLASSTVAMSEKNYELTMSQLEGIRKRIMQAATDREAANRVYEFSFQVGPLSPDPASVRIRREKGGAA